MVGLCVTRRGGGAPLLQAGRNALSYRPHCRQDTQEAERAGADDLLTVDEHRELAIVAVHDVNSDAELVPQRGRHPGGLNR